MASGLFLLDGDAKPRRLAPAAFDTEAEFQELLARFPELLTDASFGEDTPRRWLLVAREAIVPDKLDGSGRWSLDHLFLDQDGVPTLVEIKRASDTRVRREVAGQMLDYAANALARWTERDIQALLEKRCLAEKLDPAQELEGQLELEDTQVAAYWGRVKKNLESRTIRLVFVADRIERELAAIVEFLNEQMRTVTVVGLELSLHANGGQRILSPRLIGLTAETVERKSTGAPALLSTEEWLMSVAKPGGGAASNQIVEMLRGLGASPRTARGSLCFDFELAVGVRALFYLRASGKLAVSLWNLCKIPAFADDAARRALYDRFVSEGFAMSPTAMNGEPTFSLPAIDDAQKWRSLSALLSETVARARERKPTSAS
jgi:hypothetical protein